MSRKLGVGVIGLGMGAVLHGKSLVDLADRVEVTGVFSPNPQRRRGFAERFGFPQAASAQALIEHDNTDIVMVLTPPNARRELVEACIRARKPILMEKPVERDTRSATELVERCEQAGISLGIVFQHRFREGTLALRDRIARGALGRLETVQLSVPWWRPQGYYDEPGRGTYARDGGGVLISQAIHIMDLMLSLTGPAESVAAMAGTTGLHRTEAEDFVAAGLRFANGAIGSLIATTAHFPGGAEAVSLAGTAATASFKGGTLDIAYHDGRRERIGETSKGGCGADPMDFPHDWHKRVIEDFLDAVIEKRRPAIPGRAALEVHKLIDALILSSRDQRQVALSEIAWLMQTSNGPGHVGECIERYMHSAHPS